MATIHTTTIISEIATHYEHSVFICFVLITQQTAIISLYTVWFIILKEGVHCAVRNEYLDTIQVKLRSMTVISHSGSHVTSSGIFCGKSGNWKALFFRVFQISSVSTIPPLLHTHPSIYHPHRIMFLSQYSSVFPCQYHSTIAPYSFIHLPPTL